MMDSGTRGAIWNSRSVGMAALVLGLSLSVYTFLVFSFSSCCSFLLLKSGQSWAFVSQYGIRNVEVEDLVETASANSVRLLAPGRRFEHSALRNLAGALCKLTYMV